MSSSKFEPCSDWIAAAVEPLPAHFSLAFPFVENGCWTTRTNEMVGPDRLLVPMERRCSFVPVDRGSKRWEDDDDAAVAEVSRISIDNEFHFPWRLSSIDSSFSRVAKDSNSNNNRRRHSSRHSN